MDQPPLVKDQPIVRHRLTVIEKLYHQTHGGEPVCIESTYEIQLQTDEEVYSRNQTIDETPVTLDYGWLNGKPINQIIVTNKETAPNKVIKIDFGGLAGLFILPGQSSRFLPGSPVTIYSKSGSLKCKIQVIPG